MEVEENRWMCYKVEFRRSNIHTYVRTYVCVYVYIHFEPFKIWGHLEMSLFLKEKHIVLSI